MTPKYKIGQKVKIEGVIMGIDKGDKKLPYKITISSGFNNDYNLWVSKEYLSPAEETKEEKKKIEKLETHQFSSPAPEELHDFGIVADKINEICDIINDLLLDNNKK